MPVTVRPDFVASWKDSVLVRNFFFHLRTVSKDTLFSDSMHTLALGKQRWPNVRPTSGIDWSITVGYTTLAHCWAYVHLRHSHSIANVGWWHNIGPTLSQCCKMFPYFTETMTLAQHWPNVCQLPFFKYLFKNSFWSITYIYTKLWNIWYV